MKLYITKSKNDAFPSYFKRIDNWLYSGQFTIEDAIICDVVSRDDLSIEEELEFFTERFLILSIDISNISDISISNIKKDHPELFI